MLIPPDCPIPPSACPSPTNDARGVKLSLAVQDALNDIVAARRPLSDYDQMVKDWQANGGDQIRTEFQEQIATRG